MNIKNTRESESKIPRPVAWRHEGKEILLDAFNFGRILHEHLRSRTLIRAQNFVYFQNGKQNRKCSFVAGKQN